VNPQPDRRVLYHVFGASVAGQPVRDGKAENTVNLLKTNFTRSAN
jgi:hypothetical protein